MEAPQLVLKAVLTKPGLSVGLWGSRLTEDKAREEALEKAKEQLRSEDRDQFIVKAVKLLDQVEEELGKKMERFRDLYGMHFPELVDEIDEDEELLEVLSRGVERGELDAFESLAEDSTGSELGEPEKEVLEGTVENLSEDRDYRDELENYIIEAVEEEMPNLFALLEPLLAAKILELSGSLEKLAKSPASTIQMLGAEKALFRYLGGEGTPPKHGALFHHRFVSSLPEEERGKMARFLANKAAMAARLDQYGEKQKGEELRKEAEQKYEELKDN